MHIQNLLTSDELVRIDNQPYYEGYVRKLSEVFGAKQLSFHLEIIDPKNFSAPYHFHAGEEEMFVVLDGEAIVRRQNKFRKVGPGDVIFYEVGPDSAHNMYNHTDKPFRFLGIASVVPVDHCFYPDSKKQTSEAGILQDGKIVDYFKDEEDPAKYWPAHALRGEV